MMKGLSEEIMDNLETACVKDGYNKCLKDVEKLIGDWWKEFCVKVLDDGQDEDKMFRKLEQKLSEMWK